MLYVPGIMSGYFLPRELKVHILYKSSTYSISYIFGGKRIKELLQRNGEYKKVSKNGPGVGPSIRVYKMGGELYDILSLLRDRSSISTYTIEGFINAWGIGE